MMAAVEFTFDSAVMLFDQPYFHAIGQSSYDVAPDGRFAMIALAGGPAPSQDPRGIVVVQNWVEELKRLVPTK
jgi:hypothetical protein